MTIYHNNSPMALWISDSLAVYWHTLAALVGVLVECIGSQTRPSALLPTAPILLEYSAHLWVKEPVETLKDPSALFQPSAVLVLGTLRKKKRTTKLISLGHFWACDFPTPGTIQVMFYCHTSYGWNCILTIGDKTLPASPEAAYSDLSFTPFIARRKETKSFKHSCKLQVYPKQSLHTAENTLSAPLDRAPGQLPINSTTA